MVATLGTRVTHADEDGQRSEHSGESLSPAKERCPLAGLRADPSCYTQERQLAMGVAMSTGNRRAYYRIVVTDGTGNCPTAPRNQSRQAPFPPHG